MKHRSLASLIMGGAVLAAAAVVAAWPEPAEEAPEPRQLRAVRVVPVETAESSRTVRLAGVTRAADRATLSFAIPARLASRPVEVGDRVRAGQILATLDDREYRLAEEAAAAALAELDVRLAQAGRDLERVQVLAAARAATAEEVEQVQAGASALEAAREAAEARHADTRRLRDESVMRAPFDGTVTAVLVEPGEWAAPGVPVLSLAGAGALEVRVEAPEAVRARLAEGQPVTVALPFIDRSVGGRISQLAGASGGAGGLFPVEVALAPDPELVPGLAAELVLSLCEEPSLTVPLEAVLNPGSSHPTVFRIRGDQAEQVPVRLGRMLGERVEVEAALAEGEQVAVSGHTSLVDRDVVEVFR